MTVDDTAGQQLLTALVAARPPMDDRDRVLARAVYRGLAFGRPVSDSDLALTTGHGAQWVHERLARWPGVYRDAANQVIGFWGLTVTDMPPHRYCIGHVELAAWCAFDPLFITPILGAAATVGSVDADTGRPVRLTIAADGTITDAQPEIVVSFLDPTGRFDADVIESFCHYVHYFANGDSGERWTSRHPGTYLLDLDTAVAVARGYAADLRDGAG